MRLLRAVGFLLLSLSWGALGVAPVSAAEPTTIKVGISVGAQEQIFKVVQQEAARLGLKIQLVVFNDYNLPNSALNDGDINANAFQHQPFLDAQVRARGYDLVSVAKTITAPIGIYSRRFHSLAALPDGATIGIPNDPSNENRALLLLQSKGLITINPAAAQKFQATVENVTGNPHHYKLKELEAAQLPRSLDEVDAAIINDDYVVSSGIDVAHERIGQESPDSPYANVIAVRRVDRDKPWVKTLVRAYQSQAVYDDIEKNFHGTLVPAFTVAKSHAAN